MEKRRFLCLDGLRGICALAIAFSSACNIFNIEPRAPHAYLAFDFFLCLSGFVIAHAYDAPLLLDMNFKKFLKVRCSRLNPMMIVGIFLSFTVGILSRHVVGQAQSAQVAPITAFVYVIFPIVLLARGRAFCLDSFIWPLFFAYGASLLYAFDRRVTQLSAPKFISGVLLTGLTLVLLLKHIGSVAYLNIFETRSFVYGIVRSAYPFMTGIVIYRCNLYYSRRINAPPLLLYVALLVILSFPSSLHSWFYDLAIILFGFPLLIALGANVPNARGLGKVEALVGRLSYPFCVVNHPILTIIRMWSLNDSLAHNMPWLFPALGLSAAALISYGLLTLYDEPMRQAGKRNNLALKRQIAA